MAQSISILGVSYDWIYGAMYFLGLAILFIFSLEKFDKPYPGNQHLGELLPSNLSPGSSYVKAFLVYFALIMGFFTVGGLFFGTATSVGKVLFDVDPASLGANDAGRAAGAVGDPKQAPTEIPLVIALLMVGLFPKYKRFGELEAPIRRFSHRLIGVPNGLEELSTLVATYPTEGADLSNDDLTLAGSVRQFLGYRWAEMRDWERSRLALHLGIDELDPQAKAGSSALKSEKQNEWDQLRDELAPSLRVATMWHRARYLVTHILQEPSPGSRATILDSVARTKYNKLRNDLNSAYQQLSEDFQAAVEEQRKLSDMVERMRDLTKTKPRAMSEDDSNEIITSLRLLMQKRLDDMVEAKGRIAMILDKAHLYIAASTILQRNKADRETMIRYFGLSGDPEPVPPPIDAVVLAVLSMVGILFVFNLVLNYVLLFSAWTTWNPSEAALTLVVSALLMHGGAAILGYFWRSRRAKKWEQRTSPPVLEFVWAGLLVYVVMLAGLFAWGFVNFALDPDRAAAPLSASGLFMDYVARSAGLRLAYSVASAAPVATTVFVMLNIDTVVRREVTRRLVATRAAAQGFATGLIVFVYTQIHVPNDSYLEVTLSLNGIVIGLSLGIAVLKLGATRTQSLQRPSAGQIGTQFASAT